MAQNLLIEIQIQDNQVRAKIDGLQNSFDTLENTIKTAREELSKMNATSQGTVKGYSEQIRALEELRDKTAKTNEQYRAQTEEIQKLKDAQNAISGPMKGSVGDLMQQRNALMAQQKATSRTAAEFDKYQKKIIQVQSRIDLLSGSTRKNVKVNEDLISNAGLAGATLTEVGRTISDLPYGIRGVTNNLSQLSTLFVTLISKTDGATNAFALLGKQLKGPLGIILAFQAVIAAIDFFFGSTKKAEEATNDLSDAIDNQVKKFDDLARTYDQIELIRNRRGLVERKRIKETEEELRNTVKVLSTEFSEFNKMFENLTDLSDESVNELIEDFRTLLQNQEKINKTEKALIENRKKDQFNNEVIRERNKLQKDLKNIILENLDIRKKYAVDTFDVLEKEIELTDDLTEANKRFFKSMEEYIELQKLLGDEPLLIPELREDAFDADQFINQIVDLNRFRTQFTSLSESQIIDIQEQSALKQFSILTKGLEDVIDVEAEKLKIKEFFAQKRKELADSELQQALREVQELISGMSDAMAMLSDAELSREERKTAMLNNELKERLRNENLSAKERERINKQIEANELALQKRRDEIAERNFRLQKAFAIAQAAINTALAVSDVLAREKGGFIKKSVAAIAIGILGAAQIAAIASTKFVPTATSVPSGAGGISGGGAGAPAQQEPIFNIVGTGTQMQLAETVAQRTGEPVKAYVVSNDVTTAQELDRNIITGSAIG
tara:strand:+ start:843 stop:3026 length:2184 start_codon:yes stop_codon:yes gene_type:complete